MLNRDAIGPLAFLSANERLATLQHITMEDDGEEPTTKLSRERMLGGQQIGVCCHCVKTCAS